ncbi:hypothetical protein ES703_46551 [subsurface metagenome]
MTTKVQCPHCMAIFTNREDLHDHIERCHPLTKGYDPKTRKGTIQRRLK